MTSEYQKADAVVISPHPDDAEFGAAGTVARWSRAGKKVVYVVCTNGDKGTTDRTIVPQDLIRMREREQKAAAAILGVSQVEFLGLADQGLEDTPEFRERIVRIIRQYRPETVLTSDPYRRYLWHRDHRITGQVVMDAVYPYARDHLAYPEMLALGLEPHKVRSVLFWAAEDVNYRSDITDTFELKLAALQCHVSQVRELGIADLREWLLRRCRDMAQGAAFELAESFHRVKLPD
jgi:LmbE family N-acetylglucosaminyl deacetylase